ncbi:MAG TPA: hypothetical protein VGB89_01540 [Bacteroidota bacterium]
MGKKKLTDKWEAQLKIEELSKKAASAKDDLKVEYEKQIKILKDKQVEGAKKLEQIKSSADAAWDEVKAGAEMSGTK